MTLEFKGWVRTSLIDFPGHIATVFFTGGCNFRCPMCHNADLVLRPGDLPTLSDAEVWAFLEKRVGKVTGVVVTGGEPTLGPDLPDFLRRVRALGYAVKLDTNGYRPDALAALLDADLLDYVAMDIKAPPEKYAQLSGIPGTEIARIEQSLALLASSGVPYELRTTVVPGLLDVDDIEAVARWIMVSTDSTDLTEGEIPLPSVQSVEYILQQFRGTNTLDPALATRAPYAMDVLHAMADRAQRWLPRVEVRGG
jgi:pyruvate formate lyase activating enzyme